MKHIEVNIWKACNNKCRFCMSAFVWNDEKELTDFELVRKEIRTYADKGYQSIGFLGWDISIHPKVYEIVNEAKLCWFKRIHIVTNWMIFSDFKKAEMLVSAGVTRVNISVHSHESTAEDYLTQIPGWLIRKLKAIDNFNTLHNSWLLESKLSINLVLNQLNYRDILNTCVYFYKTRNIKDIRINYLWNRYFYTKEDKEKLELSYIEFLPHLKQLIFLSTKSDLRITFDSIPPCIFNKIWCSDIECVIEKFLWEKGDHIEEISNINKNEVFNWKEQKINKLKTKFKQCHECVYSSECHWVWKEYAKRYWTSEFNPIKEQICDT